MQELKRLCLLLLYFVHLLGTGLLCESLLWATYDLNLLTVWLLSLPGECHIADLFSCCSGDADTMIVTYAVEHFRFQVFVTVIFASSFKAALKTHLFNNYF